MPPRPESVVASTTLPTSIPAKKPETETRRQRLARVLGVGQAMSKTTPTLPTVTSAPAATQAPAKSMAPRAESATAGTKLPKLATAQSASSSSSLTSSRPQLFEQSAEAPKRQAAANKYKIAD